MTQVLFDSATVRLSAATEAVSELARRSVVTILGSRGQGAGIVLPDGLVATSAHVINEERPRLDFGDGKHLEASLVSVDPSHDLALLRVNGTPPEALQATLRAAATLRVGEVVLALGHPWGRRNSTTLGVVSRHLDEPLPPGVPLARAVVADVRMAPGNSGGPLIDAAGRVVGVNSMIAGGLAVAAPSEAIETLLEGRQGQRGRLGMVGVLVEAGGAPGLLVTEIAADSPAEASGFIPGDVLLGIEGGAGVPAVLEGLLAGQPRRWRVLRGGGAIVIEATARAA
jgi:serine protease Do